MKISIHGDTEWQLAHGAVDRAFAFCRTHPLSERGTGAGNGVTYHDRDAKYLVYYTKDGVTVVIERVRNG